MADTPAQAPPGNTRDTDERESYYLASQWQLMWRNFKRHRLALVSAAVLAIAYLVGFLAPFVAPYTLEQRHVAYIFVPPQRIRLFADGRLSAPYVVGLQKNVNQETLRRVYTPTAERYPIRLLGRGPEYRLWGLFPTDRHLFSVAEGGVVFLLGTDRMGPRPVLAHRVRRAHLAHHRPARGVLLAADRPHLGRRIGLLRRCRGHDRASWPRPRCRSWAWGCARR